MTRNPADVAKERAVAAKLARFLADLRQQRGLDVRTVAERAAISVDRLQAAETGEVTLRSTELRRLANVLAVPEIVLLAELRLLNLEHRPDGLQRTDRSEERYG